MLLKELLKMSSRIRFLMSLIAFAVLLRLIPYVFTTYDLKLGTSTLFYPWNFSPMMAISLFAGASALNWRLRFALPLLMLFISDLGIWCLTGQFDWGFPADRWSAYVCSLVAVLLGSGLNQKSAGIRPFAAVGRGLFAEAMFFVVTNFAYFCSQSNLPHDVSGLVACYVAAIPFAGRSFASTAFYSLLLFSPLTAPASSIGEERKSALQPAQ
jgi:hypothetical protein